MRSQITDRVKAALIAAVIAGALLAVAAWAAPVAASPPWSGIGARLADWARVHPKDTTGCPTGGCYGRRVTVGGRATARFVEVAHTGLPDDRVDGYIQALGDGTSLGAAKAAVRALLPADAQTTAFWIAHSHGDSCALWNVRSRTLARLLAGSGAEDPGGVLGINLYTVTNAGTEYSPRDVSEAAVATAVNAADASC